MNCPCGTLTRDDAYVCDGCLNDLTRLLAETPWLCGELETTIAGERGIDYTAVGQARTSSLVGKKGEETEEEARAADAQVRLPFNVAASEARRAYRHALAMCVRFCTEEGVRHQAPTNRQPVDSLESMSRWLMWRVDGLAFNDMAYEFVSEITSTARACRRAIDRKPERRYAGPCQCGRDLYHKPGAAEVTCRECNTTYDVGELYEWMRQGVMGRLVTAREGSTLLGRFNLATPQATIDKWHERKRIVDHGRDNAGHRVYLVDDLFELAARNATKLG